MCDNKSILKTNEGLFITQNEEVLKFHRDVTDLSKFMLSDQDLKN